MRIAFSFCRCTRTESVFIPRSRSQAANGSGACPQSIIFCRTSSMYGALPITAPATTSWCPLRNFVALCTTTSAPHSIGRRFTGLANVESTTSATPVSLAMWLIGRRSTTRHVGFTGDSTKMTRVSRRIRFRQPRVSNGFTKVTSIPICPSSCWSRRCVPP
jgi:hypothetical protein